MMELLPCKIDKMVGEPTNQTNTFHYINLYAAGMHQKR